MVAKTAYWGRFSQSWLCQMPERECFPTGGTTMLDPHSFDQISGFRSEETPKRRSWRQLNWPVIACMCGLVLLGVYAWRLL